MLGVVVTLGWQLLGPRAAHAQTTARPQAATRGQPAPTRGDDALGYAIIVGSNPGGRGQQRLQYAEADAERVAAMLSELGGYAAERVVLLQGPGRAQLLAQLDKLAAELQQHAAAERPTKLFFYYSGHARAGAINLGSDEVALGELRARLLGLPTTVTLVVLDACQSGAFSRIKGAEAAATFSINSVNRLAARGVAVMASSSALELSQESSELASSYFTHHLLVGLRGAADRDGDGQVTLDEAYAYGRKQTLIATTATQVGAQHVTLETDLRGKGDLVLSYPALASAQLRLPSELEANVLIVQRPQGNVLCELNKAAGESLQIALPPSSYRVWLRETTSARRCDVSLSDATSSELRPSACERVPLAEATTKSGAPPHELWSFELGLGIGGSHQDAFDSRLRDFGFQRSSPRASSLTGDGSARFGLAVGLRLHRHLALSAYLHNLDASEYRRDERIAGMPSTTIFTSSAYALGLGIRGLLPLAGGVLTPYAQAGVGLALGFTEFRQSAQAEVSDSFSSYHLLGGLGLQFMPSRHFGLFAEFDYVVAPAIDNRLGDDHDSGGHALRLGVRAATWDAGP